MKIEEALRYYLNNHSEVKALVNSRIYPFHTQAAATFPFITYRRISSERLITHDQTASGLSSPRFQFDIMADTYDDALEVAEALRNALQGYKGKMGSGTGVQVGSVLPALEQHSDEPDKKKYRITVDYIVTHQEE